MARVSKGGKLVAGWLIERPTIGTNYMYQATSAVRPGECHRFPNMERAERWAIAHDVQAADLAAATAGAGERAPHHGADAARGRVAARRPVDA